MSVLEGMYFYDARSLAKELRNGTFSEQRAVKQMIGSILLFGLIGGTPVSIEVSGSGPAMLAFAYTIVIAALVLAVIVRGVWTTYRANAEGDGKDYFLRIAALALPVGVQMILIFVVVGLVMALLFVALVKGMTPIGRLVMVVSAAALLPAFVLAFLLRMRKYLRYCSGADG